MFADDTQLFNKNDESVKKSFDILTIYEKASGVLKMVVQESETITIKFILDKVKKNQSEAAKILGMNRGTLKKKIELYKL